MADLEITDVNASANAGPSTSTTPAKPHIDDHKPNPKVAVAVAGAALALTTGLTLLVLPYVRQAAKLSAPPQFLSHAHRSRPLRALDAATPGAKAEPGVKAAAAIQPIANNMAPAPSQEFPPPADTERSYGPPQTTPDAEPSTITPPAEPLSPLEASRAFNNREEDALYGPAHEEGETLHPVSPWLGFQALGIATAIVGASTALGVWGAAKWLGVGSMEEFAAKMRGSLEDQLPDLVTNVRRDDGRVLETGPNVLGGDGDVDDGKLGQWIRWIEGDGRKRDSKGE